METATKKLDVRAGKAKLELRAGKDGAPPTLVGRAIVFDELSENLGGFREKIESTAFDKSLKNEDVRALGHHDRAMVIGRETAGTLKLDKRDDGIYAEIDLPDTQCGRDLAESVERGDLDGMSFGFRTIDDKWEEDDDGRLTRTVKEATLREISVVAFPAYSQTSVALRSLDEVLAEGRAAVKPPEVESEERESDPEPEKPDEKGEATRDDHADMLVQQWELTKRSCS